MQRAKNQCAPDVPWGQFGLIHIQNLCDNSAKMQPWQKTDKEYTCIKNHYGYHDQILLFKSNRLGDKTH